MTVKELITALQTMPQDLPVCIQDDDTGDYCDIEIVNEDVEMILNDTKPEIISRNIVIIG